MAGASLRLSSAATCSSHIVIRRSFTFNLFHSRIPLLVLLFAACCLWQVYYLQLFLHAFYGFLIGAVFYQIKPSFEHMNDIFSGVTWIVFLQAYIHVFKVC